MNDEDLKYVNKRFIVQASIKEPGEQEQIICKDAVMNISGKDFVIISSGEEVFRTKHKSLQAYRLLSGNGMELIEETRKNRKRTVKVNFVHDVTSVKWRK